MKRLFHILIAGVSSVSLLLCIAALIFWVRGYDLRATPDRCPECGTQPEMAK